MAVSSAALDVSAGRQFAGGDSDFPAAASCHSHPVIGSPLLPTENLCVGVHACPGLSDPDEAPRTATETFWGLEAAGNCWDSSICELFHLVKVERFSALSNHNRIVRKIIDVCWENALQGARFGHNGGNVIQWSNSLLSARNVSCGAEWSTS